MATLLGNCSFGGIPFDIEATSSDGWFPVPAMTQEGMTTITLPILLDSHVDWTDFRALQSKVEFKPTVGALGGRLYVSAGVGAKVLIIPTGVNGANVSYSAVLTATAARRHGWDFGLYSADATWTLLT